MKIIFTPGPGVKVVGHSAGVVIMPPSPNGQASEAGKRRESEELEEGKGQERVEGREKGELRPEEVRRILGELNIRPEEIADKKLSEKVRQVLHLVEQLSAGYEQMRAENQALRDAMNLLKGEQGQPKIKAKKKEEEDDDGSEN